MAAGGVLRNQIEEEQLQQAQAQALSFEGQAALVGLQEIERAMTSRRPSAGVPRSRHEEQALDRTRRRRAQARNFGEDVAEFEMEDVARPRRSAGSSVQDIRLESPSQPVVNKPEVYKCNKKTTSLTGFKYIQQRQYGCVNTHASRLFEDHVASHLPRILEEQEFPLGRINKVFASKWLNDRQVVFGTKCNQLVVIDVQTGQMTSIPTLKSSEESVAAEQPCGIHGISINPSGTMLATGASHTNDIGIYKLPTFDPCCVGEGAHSDWIFDLEWVDDEFLITGSRDNNIALWRIDNVDESHTSRMSCLYVPEYAVKKPLVVKQCLKAQKVRALSINQPKKEMAVLSLNAHLHLWDIETFQQIWSSRLMCGRENVCMAVSEDKGLYAVGSHNYVTLVDPKKKTCYPIAAQRDRGLPVFQGVRSVSFRKNIITIGTGMGLVLFYDVRAMKYLESLYSPQTPCQLLIGSGWLREDENFRDLILAGAYPNATYTHAYDDSGVRLFTAGGPLPAQLWGNYAAVWS